MTAKKGTLWKTSWNRRRGGPPPPNAGPMFFFRNFTEEGANAIYQGVNDSSLGLTLPFWFGVVGMRDSNQQAVGSPAFVAVPRSDDDSISVVGTISGADFALSIPAYGGTVIPSAALVVVRDDGDGSFTVRVVLNNQASVFVQGVGAFSPATTPIELSTDILPGSFHGMSGGSADLTMEEMNDWFVGLKQNREIQPIPGKTSHLYSAASVVGVPATLPNGGSDGAAQDLDYVVLEGVPAPVNTSTQVRFDW